MKLLQHHHMKKLFLNLLCFFLVMSISYGNTSKRKKSKDAIDTNTLDVEKIVDSLELRLPEVEGLEKLNVLTSLCEKLNNANPNKAYNYVGEGLDLARDLKDPIREADLLRYKSNIHQAKGESKKSEAELSHALEINQRLNHSIGVANCLNTQGQNLKVKGNYEAALNKHEKALIIFDSLGTVRDVVNTKQNIGTVYMRQSNYSKALEYYEDVIDVCTKEQLEPELTYAYCNKAFVLNSFGQPAEALDIYFNVLDRFRRQNDIYNQTKLYHHIGYTLEESQLYEEALYYYKDVLNYYENVGNKEYISFILDNYGSVLLSMNQHQEALPYFQRSLQLKTESDILSVGLPLRKMGLVYQKEKNYTQALLFAQKSLDAYTMVKDTGGMAMAYNDLSFLYLQKKKLGIAEKYSLKALDHLKQFKLIRGVKTSYENLVDIYTQRKNFSKVVQFQQLLESVKDSLYSVNKIHAINKKLVQEKLKEKELEIATLKENESQQEQEIVALKTDKMATTHRQYLMSGLSLLMIFLVGFLYKKNQKKQLEQQQSIEAELQAVHLSKEKLSSQLASIEKEVLATPNVLENPLSNKSIVLPGTTDHVVVHFSQIIRINAQSNYSTFHLEGNKEITSSYSLKHFEELLPSELFFRTHKSHIVNLQKVISFESGRTGKAFLSDGSKVNIAARRKSMFSNVMNNMSLIR